MNKKIWMLLVAAVLLIWTPYGSKPVLAASSAVEIISGDKSSPASDCVFLGIPGSYITEVDAALARINELRLEACEEGVINPSTGEPLTIEDYVPIKWSSDLEKIARIRAAEASVTQAHKRCDKGSCFAISSGGVSSCAEVIAWNWTSTMTWGIEQWYREKSDWVNQTSGAVTGHYTNMIDPENTYVGLGTFCSDITHYYNATVGEFSGTERTLDQTPGDPVENCIQIVNVSKTAVTGDLAFSEVPSLQAGADDLVSVTASVTYNNAWGYDVTTSGLYVIDPKVVSSDTSIVSVDTVNRYQVAVKGLNCGSSVLTATSGSAAGSCDVNVEHSYNEESIVPSAAATCTEDGYTEEIRCSACGQIIKTRETLAALGHDYHAVVTAPTCTEDGYTTYTCARCGDTYTDDITAASGHRMGEWETVEAPDCTNQGSRKRNCMACGYTETENLDPLGHDWEDEYTIDVEPTCTAEGSESIHCRQCDAVRDSRKLEKTEHTLGDWVTVTDVTCLEDGLKERTCAYCDYSESSIIPASGHDYQMEVAEPTCTEDGYTVFTCSRCGDTYDGNVIAALGHTVVTDAAVSATYEETGLTEGSHCDICGEVMTAQTVIPMQVLGVPVLSGVANTTAGIKVTWEPVTDAEKYRVYYRTVGGSWILAGETTATSYTVTKLTSGSTYNFTIRACIGTVGSGYDKTGISLRYLASQQPTVTNGSSGITVKWSKVTGASGYYVYRKLSTDLKYTRVATIKSGSTVTWTDKNAVNGATYLYCFRAYSGTTMGSYIGTTTVRLSTPTISSAVNVSGKKMTVKWSKNSKVTGYQIRYSTSSTFAASYTKTVSVTAASTVSRTISSLTKGKTYYVSVRGYKTVDGVKYYSGWSTKKSVKIAK